MAIDRYDYIVFGSGPAGVSAAFPLAQSGKKVLIVDADSGSEPTSPKGNYLSLRNSDNKQPDWMIGENFHAIKNAGACSPKLRVPGLAKVFEGYNDANKITSNNFMAVGSLSSGGLSSAWGCGVSEFTEEDMMEYPSVVRKGIMQSYMHIEKRVPVSGKSTDSISGELGINTYSSPPLGLDRNQEIIYKNHNNARVTGEFLLGHARTAVRNKDKHGERGCSKCGLCLWGCSRGSLYSSKDDLNELRKYPNVSVYNGQLLKEFIKKGDCWECLLIARNTGIESRVIATKLIMAMGTLATTKHILKKIPGIKKLRLLSNPSSAFMLWLPRQSNNVVQESFALGQLSYVIRNQGIKSYGLLYSTSNLPLSEFVKYAPIRRREAIGLMSKLMPSMVVGNVFFSGHFSNHHVALNDKDELEIIGGYGSEYEAYNQETKRKIARHFRRLGAYMVPKSFVNSQPGSDFHYASTLPMKDNPKCGETSKDGEVHGLPGVFVVDGASLSDLPAKQHTYTIMANADRIARNILSAELGERKVINCLQIA